MFSFSALLKDTVSLLSFFFLSVTGRVVCLLQVLRTLGVVSTLESEGGASLDSRLSHTSPMQCALCDP